MSLRFLAAAGRVSKKRPPEMTRGLSTIGIQACRDVTELTATREPMRYAGWLEDSS